MPTLSVSSAWDSTRRFVQREFMLLLPVALAFVTIPGAIYQWLMPDVRTASALDDPALAGQLALSLLTAFASATITALALGDRMSVAEALIVALRRLWVLIVASMLGGFLIGLLLAPLLPLGAMARVGADGVPAFGLGTALFILVAAVGIGALMLLVLVRLILLIPPIAMAEPVGPIEALRRSFRLTRGHGWRLLGALMLFILAVGLVSFALTPAIGSVFLLLGRAVGDQGLGLFLVALVAGVANAVLITYGNVFFAMIYTQLAGASRGM